MYLFLFIFYFIIPYWFFLFLFFFLSYVINTAEKPHATGRSTLIWKTISYHLDKGSFNGLECSLPLQDANYCISASRAGFLNLSLDWCLLMERVSVWKKEEKTVAKGIGNSTPSPSLYPTSPVVICSKHYGKHFVTDSSCTIPFQKLIVSQPWANKETASSKDICCGLFSLCVRKTTLDFRQVEDGLGHKHVSMKSTGHSTKPCHAFCALQPLGGSSAFMRFLLEHAFALPIVW